MIQVIDKRKVFEWAKDKSNHHHCWVRTERDVRKAMKIISLYFKYVLETLLEKKEVNLPFLGLLVIDKVITRPTSAQFTPRYYSNKLLRNERVMNPKMIGETVRIHFVDGFMEKNKARFKIATSFRDKLSNLLYKTEYGKTIKLCR